MDLADQWLEWDQNPQTRRVIEKLKKEKNVKELENRLSTRLEFGTAGLRGKMDGGSCYMNELTVIQASQGLAVYLRSAVENALDRGIVIGHDHRHNSIDFAQVTAAVFLHFGFKVYYYEKLVHTPMVPFGVKHLNAAAGVMITASHNPAQDNGYKVYWENASQIIPPHDSNIAKCITENLKPLTWDKGAADIMGIKCYDSMFQEYMQEVATRLPIMHPTAPIDVVYTAMHGVGSIPFKAALKHSAVEATVNHVLAQDSPDPDFPTVSFPNPEEHGALDLSIQLADSLTNVDIILANDPDADRCAVAAKKNGKFIQLSGNQLGVLFAVFILECYRLDGRDSKTLAMLNSTVSSQMLQAIAQTEGFRYEDTLTGFKWLGNRAQALEREGYLVPFAYEEAIGYMFPLVHDKDGITACIVAMRMAAYYKTQGIGLFEKLEQLYKKYGYFVSINSYFRVPTPSLTAEVFNYIRGRKSPFPDKLGRFLITSWRDLTIGYDSMTVDHVPLLPVSKSSEMITFQLDNGLVKVTMRGSGTEPKLKVYVEAKSDSISEATDICKSVWESIEREWIRGDITGLQLCPF
ncbi:hypothetical protein CANCADRAFT_30426 [Tortispora caseinolytica NRRL Y-17796]|uniref:Phosphoglucomutase n=1 Tax=Tortispora caseinolytica NRRL Y-17796 TaxID=767744 RepID=A0A1E4TKA9_9ASCO|nr:hypothetical protein CANCADRAFT_30426 [Tortispora caseinolytica NRRL Y-17796]